MPNTLSGETVVSTRLVRWWSRLPLVALRARRDRAYDRASAAFTAGRMGAWSAWLSLALKMDKAAQARGRVRQ